MKTLNDVVVGDLVVRESGSYSCFSTSIVRVGKVTPSQVLVGERGERYWKKSGDVVGGSGSWSSNSIHVPADGELEKIRRNQLRSQIATKLSEINWTKQSFETLEAVSLLIQKEKKP